MIRTLRRLCESGHSFGASSLLPRSLPQQRACGRTRICFTGPPIQIPSDFFFQLLDTGVIARLRPEEDVAVSPEADRLMDIRSVSKRPTRGHNVSTYNGFPFRSGPGSPGEYPLAPRW
jgi:hypothetical protein